MRFLILFGIFVALVAIITITGVYGIIITFVGIIAFVIYLMRKQKKHNDSQPIQTVQVTFIGERIETSGDAEYGGPWTIGIFETDGGHTLEFFESDFNSHTDVQLHKLHEGDKGTLTYQGSRIISYHIS